MRKSQQTTRIDGKRVVIRTSTSGKVTVADAFRSRKAKGRRLK
jgi:hypothetical protein